MHFDQNEQVTQNRIVGIIAGFFFRFSIDPATNVFSSTDQSINTFGNSELSQLDIEKINCLYKCDPLCGGFIAGRIVIKYYRILIYF